METTSEFEDNSVVLPDPDANKYSRGRLTCVAGSERYSGAAALAATASQRMGAGYTEVITAPAAVDVVRVASPSLVVRSLEDWRASDLPAYEEGRPCAVCVGPGFDAEDESSSDLVIDVLEAAKCPVLVDGGGLAAFGQKRVLRYIEKRRAAGWETMVTPHGGEAARMAAAWDIEENDPAKLAKKLADALGCTVVLKGPVTYISDGSVLLTMSEGTAALAKAGTGDVLAGIIGALLAQGVKPLFAAWKGCMTHARAGKVAELYYTLVSVTAEDVVESIPDAIKVIMAEGGHDENGESPWLNR